MRFRVFQSDVRHEFSPDGSEPWVQPTNLSNRRLGGSSENW